MPMTDPFHFQPPNDITKPRYEAIYDAHKACSRGVSGICDLMVLAGAKKPADHERIGSLCKAFADVIQTQCPTDAADTKRAIASVRMGRMWANRGVATSDSPTWMRCFDKSTDHLTEAKFWACSAVALALPDELPKLEAK